MLQLSYHLVIVINVIIKIGVVNIIIVCGIIVAVCGIIVAVCIIVGIDM